MCVWIVSDESEREFAQNDEMKKSASKLERAITLSTRTHFAHNAAGGAIAAHIEVERPGDGGCGVATNLDWPWCEFS